MKFLKRDIFTIPNILTYIRLLCVPFFIWMIIDYRIPNNVWWGLGIFVFASVTDVVDGFIARKCHMTSDIGKVLDPFADKLLQMAALITLTLIGYINKVFTIIIVVKEIYMIIGAMILLAYARRKVTIQSNIWGKMATVFLAMAVFSSFFHKQLEANKVYLDVFLFSVASLLTIIAAVQYTYKMIKEIKSSQKKEDNAEIVETNVDLSDADLHGGLVIDVDESEIEKDDTTQNENL